MAVVKGPMLAEIRPELYKPGRYYLLAGGPMPRCGKLPLPIIVQTPRLFEGARVGAWGKADLVDLFARRPCLFEVDCRSLCPLGYRILRIPHSEGLPFTALLVWQSVKRYPRPGAWRDEAARHGVRWPIRSLPPYLRAGLTWVLVGHPRCFEPATGPAVPAIVEAFRVEHVEYIARSKRDHLRMVCRMAHGDLPPGLTISMPPAAAGGKKGGARACRS